MDRLLQNTKYGIRADDKYFLDMPKLEMPAQESDKIVTLNQQGFMRVELDRLSQKWIESASTSELPSLEIGAAYGQASIAALKLGGTIIANDISPEHLIILRNRIDPTLREKLYLNNCSFPEEVNIPNNSVGNILFCRLGHFFTDTLLVESFNKAYEWLVPGGKTYFIAISPYHYTLKEKFLPIFQKKIINNDKNPGYIDDMREYIPRSADKIPAFMNCFDEISFSNIIKETKFTIKDCFLFDYKKNNSDGKGFLGAELVK